MWKVTGKAEVTTLLLASPVHVFSPRLFTIRDQSDNVHLAYICDGSGGAGQIAHRHIIVPISARRLNDLAENKISVREAIDCARTWVIDTDAANLITGSWRVNPFDLPAEAWPKEDVKLLQFLEETGGDERDTGQGRETDGE